MFVQTVTTCTLISTHCGVRDFNGFFQSTSTSFLAIQNSISVCLLNSRYNYSRNVVFCKSRNYVRSPCCLSETTGSYNAPDSELGSNIDGMGNGRSIRDESGRSVEEKIFPKTIPRKSRRGRKSEAVAVEDFIRNSLEQTFASIREKSSEVPENMEHIIKGRTDEENNDSEFNNSKDGNDDVGTKEKKKMIVEDESKNWPLDADVGWGTRASEYFDQHPIRNIVGDDGVEIDWEGEMDEGWVKEINCLEWEDFAFHPSPLIVLVFERYNRASDNWKVLRELEKAAKVYWDRENCLPPRTVKIDINIERDLAYALKVEKGPELLFLRGNRIIFREKNIRTSDELVQMIAHFYYKAKKPAWI